MAAMLPNFYLDIGNIMNLEIPNPEDGMVIEVFPGVFYVYRARENSWIRINGYESIKPATQINSGLMTKEDFVKIDELLTSPPKTNLTSEQCDAVFDAGIIRLYSDDRSVHVEDYLDLYGDNGDGTTREQWHVHEDTWGFNFRVNLNFLVEEMQKRGNLISETIVGSKGPEGERGEPGIDRLDTGPRGAAGEDGLNAPFGGGLSNNSDLILKDKSRAIVDVSTEMISPEENYLVVHKGVISPENLCTNKVTAEDIQSTWILVKNQSAICDQACSTSPCATSFIDIEVITNSIREHFDSLILELKESKEAQVREWLQTMMKVFNDQKYSLCCGLENCRSRKRNQDERRYIESSRIAAAAADFNLVISGSRDGESVPEPHTKVDIDMDEFKSCEGPGWVPTVVTPVSKPLNWLILAFFSASVDYAPIGPSDVPVEEDAGFDNDLERWKTQNKIYGSNNKIALINPYLPDPPIPSIGFRRDVAPGNFKGDSSIYMKDSPQFGTFVSRPPTFEELVEIYETVTGGITPDNIGLVDNPDGHNIKLDSGYIKFVSYLKATGAYVESNSIGQGRWLSYSARYVEGYYGV